MCAVLYCTVLYCTVLLPPGDNPIAVNKYIIYHVMCRLFLTAFNENWTFWAYILNIPNYETYTENPSSGIRVVPCGRTDTHGGTDRFGKFANAPKIVLIPTKYRKDPYEEPCTCSQKQYRDTCPSTGKLRPPATPETALSWALTFSSAAGTGN